MINALPIEELAGSNRFPVPDPPPSSSEELHVNDSKNGSSCSSSCLRGSKTLGTMSMGPRVKMRQAGAVAKKCVDEIQDRLTSIGPLIGKAFGYGFLYCDQDMQKRLHQR